MGQRIEAFPNELDEAADMSAADFETLKVEMRDRCASIWASRLLGTASRRPIAVNHRAHLRDLASLQRLEPLFISNATAIKRTVAALILGAAVAWASGIASAEGEGGWVGSNHIAGSDLFFDLDDLDLGVPGSIDDTAIS